MFDLFCILSHFFIMGEELAATSNNPVDFIINLVAFAEPGVPDWVQFLLFMLCTFPLLIILFALVAPLLNNAVTGTVVGIAALTTGILVAVNYLF